jgi:hypothetical protein
MEFNKNIVSALGVKLSDLLSISWNDPLFVTELFCDMDIEIESDHQITESIFVQNINIDKYIYHIESKYKYYEAKTIEQKLEIIVRKLNDLSANNPILLEKAYYLFGKDDKDNKIFNKPYLRYNDYNVPIDEITSTEVIRFNKMLVLVGIYIWFETEDGSKKNISDLADISLHIDGFNGKIDNSQLIKVGDISFINIYKLKIDNPQYISEWRKICKEYLLLSYKYIGGVSLHIRMKEKCVGTIHVIQADLNILRSSYGNIWFLISH